MSGLVSVYTPQLGRDVYLRPGTSDQQVWNDTFGGAGGYHVPPSNMPTPKTVLDLGANIGLTAAHYAALWPDALVWMIEPNPDSLAMASQNAPRCVPVGFAVAKDSGDVGLLEEGLQAEAYTITRDAEAADGLRRVWAMSFESLVEILGPIDFCKMDIEGSEWEVIESGVAWGDAVKHLLVEFHARGDEPSTNEVLGTGIAALENFGYSARHHPPHPQSVWAVRPV